ncbi:YgaP family membrane protein [Kerstersia sp.]|uniref:YgaP family membrane protein n=1 Tax=Kerstersia sp. TaxID=1930783 RepID=UPI003F914114
MKTNVGGIDRLLRVVAGLLLIILAASGVIGGWGWLGILPLLTGLGRYCPLYTLLGFTSCPRQTHKPQR